MPAIGAVLKVTLESTYLGQTCLNRFFYLKASGTDGGILEIEEFATSFMSTVPDTARGIMSSSARFSRLEVQNIAVPAEYIASNENVVGQGGADGLPSFVSWTFYQRRPFPPLRGGYKRFVGVPKEATVGNGVSSTYDAAITLTQDGLRAAINASGGVEYNPCVLAGYNDSAGTFTLAWVANGWIFQRLGTQNTRKP